MDEDRKADAGPKQTPTPTSPAQPEEKKAVSAEAPPRDKKKKKRGKTLKAKAADEEEQRETTSVPTITKLSTLVALPPLEARYLDTGAKFDAQRDQSRRRKEAAEVKFRLQRMFRDLDKIDLKFQEQEEKRKLRELEKPLPVLTKKMKARWKYELEEFHASLTPVPHANADDIVRRPKKKRNLR